SLTQSHHHKSTKERQVGGSSAPFSRQNPSRRCHEPSCAKPGVQPSGCSAPERVQLEGGVGSRCVNSPENFNSCQFVEFVANKTNHEFHEFHENDHRHLDVIGLNRKTRIHSVVLPRSQRCTD